MSVTVDNFIASLEKIDYLLGPYMGFVGFYALYPILAIFCTWGPEWLNSLV